MFPRSSFTESSREGVVCQPGLLQLSDISESDMIESATRAERRIILVT